jgi:hypothetical protein
MMDGYHPEEAISALLDPQKPVHDPVLQSLQVMMSGFGYNFYDAGNVARANDQIVRDKAAGMLAETDRTLRALERDYRARYIPPPSREQPFPDAQALAPLDELERLRKRIEALATTIRCFEAPGGDMVWFRIRQERATLERLLAFDVGLVGSVRALSQAVQALSVESIHERRLGELSDTSLGALASMLDARGALLALPI